MPGHSANVPFGVTDIPPVSPLAKPVDGWLQFQCIRSRLVQCPHFPPSGNLPCGAHVFHELAGAGVAVSLRGVGAFWGEKSTGKCPFPRDFEQEIRSSRVAQGKGEGGADICQVPSGCSSTPLASYTPLPMVLFPTCHFGHAAHTTGGAFGQLQFSLLLLQHSPTCSGQSVQRQQIVTSSLSLWRR